MKLKGNITNDLQVKLAIISTCCWSLSTPKNDICLFVSCILQNKVCDSFNLWCDGVKQSAFYLTTDWQEDTNTEATKYMLVQCCAVLLNVPDFEVLIHAY